MTINIFGWKMEIKKEVAAVIITSFVFLAGIGGYLIVKGNSDIIIDTSNQDKPDVSTASKSPEAEGTAGKSVAEASEAASANKADDKKDNEIKVYVVGCVNNPGVITLKKGKLIDDAIKLAGGLTKDADPLSVNLVYKLEENVMLHIKSRQETEKEFRDTAGANEAGNGVRIEKGSAGAVVNEEKKEAKSGTKSGGKVNINTASADELNTLNGIGEAKANDIISYRESNGSYKTIEDIMKVPGIKESSFNRIKDDITVN